MSFYHVSIPVVLLLPALIAVYICRLSRWHVCRIASAHLAAAGAGGRGSSKVRYISEINSLMLLNLCVPHAVIFWAAMLFLGSGYMQCVHIGVGISPVPIPKFLLIPILFSSSSPVPILEISTDTDTLI